VSAKLERPRDKENEQKEEDIEEPIIIFHVIKEDDVILFSWLFFFSCVFLSFK